MIKKLILAGVILTTASITTFAQGYFNFATAKSYVYDNFTTQGTTVVAPGTVDVAFLWAVTGTTDLLSPAGNPTNNTTAFTPANNPYNSITAMLIAGWNIATNTANNSVASIVDNASGVAKGGIAYNGGVGFQVAGTTAGNAYSVVVIGWDSTYTTLAAAIAANAAVGWSDLFTYASGASSSSPISLFSGSGMTAFGTTPITVVPEPSTMALAGLSGLAALLFRRKK